MATSRTALAAVTHHIHQSIDDPSHKDRALVATPLGTEDLRVYQRPFLVGQITRTTKPAAVLAGAVPVGPNREASAYRGRPIEQSQPTRMT